MRIHVRQDAAEYYRLVICRGHRMNLGWYDCLKLLQCRWFDAEYHSPRHYKVIPSKPANRGLRQKLNDADKWEQVKARINPHFIVPHSLVDQKLDLHE